MRTSLRLAAAAVTVGASLIAAIPAGASGSADSGSAAVRPCTVDDVSFYFGGDTQDTGPVSFDLTLLAHDGITCSLSDTPLITLSGPPSQKTPIPVEIEGRGGTLILRPDSPLHATLSYNLPDSTKDTIEVGFLTLTMPDKTSRTTDFLYPGDSEVNSDGVWITSWTTGIGLGEGEESSSS